MSAHTYELTWRHTTQKLTVLSVRPLRITGFLYAYLKKKITFIFKCWKHKNSGIKFSKVNYKKKSRNSIFFSSIDPTVFSFFCNKKWKKEKKINHEGLDLVSLPCGDDEVLQIILQSWKKNNHHKITLIFERVYRNLRN